MADSDHNERSNGRSKAAQIKAGTYPAGAPAGDAAGRPWAEVATWSVLDPTGGFYREHGRADCNSGATGPSRRV